MEYFSPEKSEEYKRIANNLEFDGKQVKNMPRDELVIYLGWLIYHHKIVEYNEWADFNRKLDAMEMK